jgi:hypothetical protein
MLRLPAILLLCLVLLSCAARGPSASSTLRPRVTGMFSSMHFTEESGDVGGMEVFITYARNGVDGHYWVRFQMAEGVPDEPALVRAIVIRNDIEFTVPDLGDFKGVARRE